MIGLIRGAMIMAPITVAVESPSTPKVAITVDRNRPKGGVAVTRGKIDVIFALNYKN